MVDTNGKPFEVTVIRSTGNPTFEKVAVKSIGHSKFEPGKLNGAPVESGFEMKYRFQNPRFQESSGPKPAFVKAYNALIAAVNSDDRATAGEALQKLRITNLYEDAYFGIATYEYASKYGDEGQQLEGLRRAIAREDDARYLPSDLFSSALISCIRLEVKEHQYAEAVATWKRLEKAGIDICSSNISKPWSARDTSRRCGSDVIRATGFFRSMKRLQYELNSKDRECSIELLGAPGTQFKLMQF